MPDDAAMHARLVAAINASTTEIYSPWYGYPSIPFDLDDALATRAIRRWRSAQRRKLGQRDKVQDLARGLIEWAEQLSDIPMPDGEKDEWRWMAEMLAGVLDAETTDRSA